MAVPKTRRPQRPGRTVKVAGRRHAVRAPDKKVPITSPAGRRNGGTAFDSSDESSSAGFDEALATALRAASPQTKETFVRGLRGGAPDIDSDLWGPAPTPAERDEDLLANLSRQYAARHATLVAAIGTSEAAELLGISTQAVLDRLRGHDLIGLKDGRQWRLPAWQFRADTARGHLDGLARLREVFPGGVVTLSHWMTRPNADLDGATPADALATDQIAKVLAAARATTAAAW
ncbi:antitoxin Xre/MbcA/ParS toxin-binding domain-containing protein [Gordonia sp. VNQ95]|uniref:antitoxin Xre/MbcA/ParS toxin-binding domain-containing protein n=1 Tax=Gordonia TaxID=2053 RepID=UPI0032B56E26